MLCVETAWINGQTFYFLEVNDPSLFVFVDNENEWYERMLSFVGEM